MKNFIKSISLILALLCVVSLAGCALNNGGAELGIPETKDTESNVPDTKETDNSADMPEVDTTVTLTDHLGKTVTVKKNAQRIVICDIYPLPSVISVFFDSADKIVGMGKQSMSAAKSGLLGQLYPEILNAKTAFIDGTSVNIEELLKLEPDVVFYSSGNPQLGETLAKAKIPGIAISASNWGFNAIETMNNWIDLLSEIYPENDKAEKVSEYSNRIYDFVQERVASITERERVFFLFQYNESTIATSGNKFFGQWWADAVGAVNVGEELDTLKSASINMEQLYEWNPTKILITNFNTSQPDDIYNNTIGNYDWSEIDAVKNEEVYKMPLGMYRSYTCGVDTPVTLLWIAKAIYPDTFADVNITAETQKYYKDVFGIELTDDMAELIFAPSSDGSAY